MRIMLDIPLSLCLIIEAMGRDATGYPDVTIYAICTDSRECEDGDLFFSLAKEKADRKRYASDAVAVGAYAVCDDAAFIEVENTEVALLRLAGYYKSRLRRLIKTVGITGSVGKSTATRYTARMLSLSYVVASTIGNFNNRIGISLSILSARADTEVLVLEMGMNHAGEIARMAEVIRPEICIVTCIGNAHIGNLGTRAAIRDAKCEIITKDAEAVICPSVEPLLSDIPHRISLSVENDDADIMLIGNGKDFSIKTPDGVIGGIELSVIGKHNRYNALIASTVCLLLGFSGDGVRRGLVSLGNGISNGKISTCGGITLIDDTYNSSPEAAYAMLEVLREYPSPYIGILGDMLELGEMAREFHYGLGMRAAFLDKLYAVGEYGEDIVRGAIEGGIDPLAVSVIHDIETSGLADTVLDGLLCGTIFIKGSHATGLSLLAKNIWERIEK